MNSVSKLQDAKFVVKRKRGGKKGKGAKIKFIIDPLYCPKCPDRLYQCLKEAEKLFGIQIYNGTKLIIIEFAASIDYDDYKGKSYCNHCYFHLNKQCPFCASFSSPNSWHSPCIRCHKGGCTNCYQRRHSECIQMVTKYRYAGRNTQQRASNSKSDRFLGGVGGIPKRHYQVKKQLFKWGSQQEKKWKHECWRKY